MKYCRKCKQTKDTAKFYWDKRRNKAVGPCKDCKVTDAAHDWRKANPEKNRQSDLKTKLKTKYGLSLELLAQLWENQDKQCAICKNSIELLTDKKALKVHVDHCHVTGVVRGLLCLTCNTGLGMFRDSLDLLSAASSYLRKPHVTPVLQEFLSDSTSVTVDNKTTLH